MKRWLVITLIILAAVILVGLGIYLRGRSIAPKNPAAGGGLPEGTTRPGGTGGNGGASGGATSTITVARSAAVAYAVLPDGTVETIGPDGTVVVASTTASVTSPLRIQNLLGASFSHDGAKVLARAGDPLDPRWSVFDLKKASWQPLALNARVAAWSPNDYRVAYFTKKLSGSSLAVMDLKAQSPKPQVIMSFAADDLLVDWVSPSRLMVRERESALVGGMLAMVDIANKTIQVLRTDAKGAEMVWGAEEGLLFEAAPAGPGGSLSLMNLKGETTQTFTFLTLPSKCSFYPTASSSQASPGEDLLCAIPRDAKGFGLSQLPDDYRKGSLFTADDLFRIDLVDGTFTPVGAAQNGDFDVISPSIRNGILYFINRLDGKLYKAPVAL